MRAFIAIPLAAEVKEKLLSLQEELERDPCLKIVPEENLHITLKFLGEIGEEEFELWKSKVDALEVQELNIALKGVGAFPSREYVRVVWVGAEGCEKLAEQLGERHFRGHITIARARCRPKLKKFLEDHKTEKFGTFPLRKVCIYESILERPYARYVERHCKKLRF